MPSVNDLSAKLVGEIPGLPRLKAVEYINQGLKEIKRDYLWSWNIAEGVINLPGAMSTGTVTTTFGSNQITFDATAKAAIAPLVMANPPFIQYQFRIPYGPLYNITAYDGSTGIATLDRIYLETPGAGQHYSCYVAYVLPPSQDGVIPDLNFLRYLSILNPIQGYSITGRRLTRPREELNRRDPLRGAQGQPYFAYAYKPVTTFPNANSSGVMLYELWPHCVTQLGLIAQYEQAAPSLLITDNLPINCSDSLVMYRAMELAYRWALQNSGRIPELRGVDWRFLLSDIQKKYALQLVQAKRNDKEIMLTILRPGSAGVLDFQGPIDSNFYQSHGLPSLT